MLMTNVALYGVFFRTGMEVVFNQTKIMAPDSGILGESNICNYTNGNFHENADPPHNSIYKYICR